MYTFEFFVSGAVRMVEILTKHYKRFTKLSKPERCILKQRYAGHPKL